jgi:hypothetical protein
VRCKRIRLAHGETRRHEAQIYQLRAVLRGISPPIGRRVGTIFGSVRATDRCAPHIGPAEANAPRFVQHIPLKYTGRSANPEFDVESPVLGAALRHRVTAKTSPFDREVHNDVGSHVI